MNGQYSRHFTCGKLTTVSDYNTSPILVTGAGKRVGFHLANRLVDDGHSVIAHYHQTGPELDSLAARGVITLQADFGQMADIQRLINNVRLKTPALRAIVHNASAFTSTPADPQSAGALFETFFSIHMLAPFLINTGLVDLLRAGAAGSVTDIVHITDIFAVNPKPEFDLYCATKAGLENLNQSFAKQYAPRIKVNSLQPGPILFKDSHTPEMRRRVLAETPLGREGGPEAVYCALRALLDNDYLTGTSIQVDGGRHLSH